MSKKGKVHVICLNDVLFDTKVGKSHDKQSRKKAAMKYDADLTDDCAKDAATGAFDHDQMCQPLRSDVLDNHLGEGGCPPKLRQDTIRFVTANVCTLNPSDAKEIK